MNEADFTGTLFSPLEVLLHFLGQGNWTEFDFMYQIDR